jgi:hypothetical protein
MIRLCATASAMACCTGIGCTGRASPGRIGATRRGRVLRRVHGCERLLDKCEAADTVIEQQ